MQFNMKKIDKIDQENMLKLLFDFPEQCREAGKFIDQVSIPSGYRDVQNILIAGMGGSAIGGDLVKAVVNDQASVPIVVNRNYTIPEFVSAQTLFIAVSYSGNTDETLRSFKVAKKVGAKIIAITSNGQLEKFASESGFPCIKVPGGQSPRASLGYLFIPLLGVLSRLGFAPNLNLRSELEESVELLSQMIDSELKPKIEDDNLAKELAKSLYGKIPIIYISENLGAIATRWKGQMCENAKNLAYCNVFPEMNHNEIEGWNYPTDFLDKCCVVMLRDGEEHPMTKARMNITAELIEEYPASIKEVESRGKSRLARIFSLICVGDWTSFYLSILNEVDPTPVPRITVLKKRLEAIKG